MYVSPNFVFKKALKNAVKAGEEITVFQPGPFGQQNIPDGEHSVEGPHAPEPHRWYARVTVENGIIVKVK